MSSSPEMDNTGRGRGRGEIHREPRFVPGQERPQGDNDGLPTYEQQEGYLLSYEEVMTGRLAPRQASETPEQEQTGWISKIMLNFCLKQHKTCLYLGCTMFILISMSLSIRILIDVSMHPEKIHYLVFPIPIVCLIIVALYTFYKGSEEMTD
ncbi:hypothetical protein TKK_0005174 [Trichogramma kaykai]